MTKCNARVWDVCRLCKLPDSHNNNKKNDGHRKYEQFVHVSSGGSSQLIILMLNIYNKNNYEHNIIFIGFLLDDRNEHQESIEGCHLLYLANIFIKVYTFITQICARVYMRLHACVCVHIRLCVRMNIAILNKKYHVGEKGPANRIKNIISGWFTGMLITEKRLFKLTFLNYHWSTRSCVSKSE